MKEIDKKLAEVTSKLKLTDKHIIYGFALAKVQENNIKGV